jgi:hypothetical protein
VLIIEEMWTRFGCFISRNEALNLSRSSSLVHFCMCDQGSLSPRGLKGYGCGPMFHKDLKGYGCGPMFHKDLKGYDCGPMHPTDLKGYGCGPIAPGV